MKMEIEESVILKIRQRRDEGRKKYGTSMERTDLSKLDWLRHAQEEAMDLAIYLEKLIQEEDRKPESLKARKCEGTGASAHSPAHRPTGSRPR